MHHIKTAGLPPDLSDAIPRQTVFGRLQRGSLREIPAADGVRVLICVDMFVVSCFLWCMSVSDGNIRKLDQLVSNG